MFYEIPTIFFVYRKMPVTKRKARGNCEEILERQNAGFVLFEPNGKEGKFII